MAFVFYEPPCACKEFCCHSFREAIGRFPFPAYSEELLDADANAIAEKHMTVINQSFHNMAWGWRNYGKSVVKKWRKMNQSKRREFLLNLYPNIYEYENFSFLEHCGMFKDEQVPAMRHLFFIDYINLPNLEKDPMRLLSLLQNRSKYHPKAWAHYDSLGLDYPWNSYKVEVKFSGLCMRIKGSETEPYGTLTAWSLEAAHRGEIIGFPRAELLLEKQAFLYEVLARAMARLMVGLQPIPQPISSSPNTELFEIDMTNRGRKDLCSIYTNQPYSRPPKAFLDLMISKAQAQVDLYNDRLWLLQTDAAYLRDTVELGKGALSSKHSALERYREAAVLISLDIWNYWSWCLVLKVYQNVKQVGFTVPANIAIGQPLPQQYQEVLQELEFVLKAHTNTRLAILNKTLAERPAFENYFIKIPFVPEPHDRALASGAAGTFDADGRDIMAIVDYYGGNFLKNDRLFYALQTLSSPNIRKDRGIVDTANRWAYLEEVLATAKPEENVSRLDGDLFEMYNSFAAADEMYFNFEFRYPKSAPVLDSQRPRYTREEAAKLGRPTVLSYAADKIFNQDCRITFHPRAPKHLEEFAKAYDAHRKDSRRDDEKRLQQLKDIDKARLDFWKNHVETRRTVLKKHGSLDESEILEDLAIISAHEDPSNFEYDIAERKRVGDRIAAKVKPKEPAPAGPSVEWDQSKPESEPISIKGKEKVKTRPDEADREPELPDIEALAIETEVPGRTQLTVSKRTLDLLVKMMSRGDEKIKDVDWNDFVSGMVEVGFIVSSTGGSMFDFEPVEDHPLGWKGRIVFHRPHPQAKIHRIMLRAFSNRLARHFEFWEMETFVEGKKGEKRDGEEDE